MLQGRVYSSKTLFCKLIAAISALAKFFFITSDLSIGMITPKISNLHASQRFGSPVLEGKEIQKVVVQIEKLWVVTWVSSVVS